MPAFTAFLSTMKDTDPLIRFYEGQGREDLRLHPNSVQHLELRTGLRCLGESLAPKSTVLDSCAGTGAYAFALAKAGHSVVAGDIVPFNVERLRARQAHHPALQDIYMGDARDLSRFADASFQAVLCMGALYHLPEARDRELVVRESLRVLAKGGLFVCTYMNRYAVALSNALAPAGTNEEIARFMRTGTHGIFYAATPGEMESLLRRAGLEQLRHVALDGPVTLLAQQSLIDSQNREKFNEYHAAVCEIPELLGYGYHNMLIARAN